MPLNEPPTRMSISKNIMISQSRFKRKNPTPEKEDVSGLEPKIGSCCMRQALFCLAKVGILLGNEKYIAPYLIFAD